MLKRWRDLIELPLRIMDAFLQRGAVKQVLKKERKVEEGRSGKGIERTQMFGDQSNGSGAVQ